METLISSTRFSLKRANRYYTYVLLCIIRRDRIKKKKKKTRVVANSKKGWKPLVYKIRDIIMVREARPGGVLPFLTRNEPRAQMGNTLPIGQIWRYNNFYNNTFFFLFLLLRSDGVATELPGTNIIVNAVGFDSDDRMERISCGFFSPPPPHYYYHRFPLKNVRWTIKVPIGWFHSRLLLVSGIPSTGLF